MKTVTYECDRCGRDIKPPAATITLKGVETGVWEHPREKRTLRVHVLLTLEDTDEDRPELCKLCQVDVLNAAGKILWEEHRLLRQATSGEYVVQAMHTMEEGWIDCVREDIERDDLPARFDSTEEAAQFIENVRGLMHMGGGDTQFQIVPFDRDPALHEPEEQEP